MEPNWLVKNPMIRFYLIAGTTVIFFATAIAALIWGNREACKSRDCEGAIIINLIGLSDSSPFKITLATDGETRIISCSVGGHNEEIPFAQSCWPTGAKFNLPTKNEPPEEITVTVEVDGKTIARVFTPVYEKAQPNGEDCPPVCYSATLPIDVSQ